MTVPVNAQPRGVGAFLDVKRDDPADWERQAARLHSLDGLAHVEVWLEHLPEHGTYRALDDLLEGFTTIVHGPFIGLSLVSPLDELRRLSIDRIARAAEVAAGFGGEVMTVHPGVAPSADDPEDITDRLLSSLATLRELVGGGLVVSVENMPCRPGPALDALVTVDQCAALLERDPATRFTLDVGHAVQNADKYEPFLREHASAIADIHLHDGDAGGKAHRALGTGALDLEEFVGALDDGGYGGFVTLETLTWQDTHSSYALARAALARP